MTGSASPGSSWRCLPGSWGHSLCSEFLWPDSRSHCSLAVQVEEASCQLSCFKKEIGAGWAIMILSSRVCLSFFAGHWVVRMVDHGGSTHIGMTRGVKWNGVSTCLCPPSEAAMSPCGWMDGDTWEQPQTS